MTIYTLGEQDLNGKFGLLGLEYGPRQSLGKAKETAVSGDNRIFLSYNCYSCGENYRIELDTGNGYVEHKDLVECVKCGSRDINNHGLTASKINVRSDPEDKEKYHEIKLRDAVE